MAVVRRFYAAWARDELPGPPELMDAKIQYVNPPGATEPGTRDGLDAFGVAVSKVSEAWESWRMEPDGMEAAGDHVAVAVHYQARGRASGIEVEGRESALWTLREGRVVRYEWFHGPRDAFEALGMRR